MSRIILLAFAEADVKSRLITIYSVFQAEVLLETLKQRYSKAEPVSKYMNLQMQSSCILRLPYCLIHLNTGIAAQTIVVLEQISDGDLDSKCSCYLTSEIIREDPLMEEIINWGWTFERIQFGQIKGSYKW